MYYSVWLLLLLFPSLCNLVRHSGSATLALLTIMGIYVMLSAQKRSSLTKYEKWAVWAFAAYFGVHLFSFAVNGLLGNLFEPRLKHLDHEFRFLFILPIFMLLRHLKITSGVFWHSVTIGALISGGYALCSHLLLSGGYRIKGSYHAIAFGDLSLALAFVSMISIEWYRRNRSNYLLLPLAASLLGIAGSVMSGTRGAWIAIPGLACVLIMYSAKHLRKRTQLLVAGAFCILAVAAYLIPATKTAERIDLALSEIVEYAQGHRNRSSFSERIEGWRAAYDIFRQNPIFGAGPGNFKPLVDEMVTKGTHHEFAALYSKPHSSYLAVMSDCGIIGLIALLLLLGMPLWLAIRHVRSNEDVRSLGYALMVLVVAFAHYALTESIFSRNVNVSFYIIMVASIMAIAANERSMNRKETQ